MIQKVKTSLVTIMISLGLLAPVVLPVPITLAQEIKSNLCGGADLSLSNPSCGKDTNNDGTISDAERAAQDATDQNKLNSLIANIVNILSIIVGIIAVIMIIIGGFKYITSGGDSGNVTSAKNTILYAVVGLIIVALAQVIVRFVLSKVGTTN